MKNITTVNQNVGQRISYDEVMTRIGDLSKKNIHALARAFLSSKDGASTIQGGNVTPVTAMTIRVAGESAWVQKKNSTNSWVIIQEADTDLVVSTADPTNPRIDLVEGRYHLVDQKQETVDIINLVSGVIAPESHFIDRIAKLDVHLEDGTPDGSPVCPDVTAAVAALYNSGNTGPFDLLTNYNIRIAVDGAAAQTVNCQGPSPAVTTAAQVAGLINTATGVSVASDDSGKVKLESPTAGEDSSIVFTPPATFDALDEIFNLTESADYEYEYLGERGYFKIAEVDVSAGATVISPGDIRDVDDRLTWKMGTTTDNERMSDLYKHQSDNPIDHPDDSIPDTKLLPSVRARLDSGGLSDGTHGTGVIPAYENEMDVVYSDESPAGDGLAVDEVRVLAGAGVVAGDGILVAPLSEVDVQLKHTPTVKVGDTLDTRVQVGQGMGIPAATGDYELLTFSSAGDEQDLKCYFEATSGDTGVVDGQTVSGTALHAGAYNPKIYKDTEGEVVDIWDLAGTTGSPTLTVSYDGVDTGIFDIDTATAKIKLVSASYGLTYQIRYTYSIERLDLIVVDTDNNVSVLEGTYTSSGVMGKPQIPTPSATQLPLRTVLVPEKETDLTVADNDLRDDRFYLPLVDQEYDVVIRNQTEFDYWFGLPTLGDEAVVGQIDTPSRTTGGGWPFAVAGGIMTVTPPEGTRVLLMPCESGGVTNTYNGVQAYLLSTRVNLTSRVEIHGRGLENTLVAPDRTTPGETGFETTYKFATDGDQAVGSPTVSNVGDTSGLSKGQTIIMENPYDQFDADPAPLNIYRITDITGGDTLTVDKDSSATQADAWVRVPVTGIVLKDFAIAGRGGVDNLPEEGTGHIDDDIFDIQYCIHSRFEALVVNVHSGDGSSSGQTNIYNGVHAYHCSVKNLRQCKVDDTSAIHGGFYLSEIGHIDRIYSIAQSSGDTNGGGAVFGCILCHIHDIANVRLASTGSGAAIRECDYCEIERVTRCEVTGGNGGAIAYSDHCTIRGVYDCEATAGTGDGGAVYSSDHCIITDIRRCISGDKGGGVAQSDYCSIDGVYDCQAGNDGGGVSESNYGTIRNVVRCKTTSVSGRGGGVFTCDDCLIENVQDCDASTTSGQGGGLYGCDRCTINTVVGCTANDGGGLHSCNYCHVADVNQCHASSGGAFGGGLHSCDYCHISNVRYCDSETGGGGLYQCDKCVIVGVVECSTLFSGNGGGLLQCNDCVVSGVYNCTVPFSGGLGGGLADCLRCSVDTVMDCVAGATGSGEGGGAYNCDDCVFHGIWRNTSAGTTSPNWDSCDDSVGHGLYGAIGSEAIFLENTTMPNTYFHTK